MDILFVWRVIITNIDDASQFLYFRISGTIGAAVLCPLEVVKTRMQVYYLLIRAYFGSSLPSTMVDLDKLMLLHKDHLLLLNISKKRLKL